MHAFCKIATRKEAEEMKLTYQGYSLGALGNLKLGWGCGYGPRDQFNYHDGTTLYEIMKIPQNDIPLIESSTRGGGPVIGGMVMEEPNVLEQRSRGPDRSGNKRSFSQVSGDDDSQSRQQHWQ